MTTRLVTSTDARTVGPSPKAVAATAGATLLGVVLAVLNAVQASPELLGGLPPVWQFLLLAAVPPLVIGLLAVRAAVGKVALPVASAVEVRDSHGA
ncbi:MAG: hypothetical protein L0H84_04620 [Pseudonocardia sp.]|nr:hypothetical protein [Pseudonocardia sp.]